MKVAMDPSMLRFALLLLLGLPGLVATAEEEPAPVDPGKVLRESPAFREQCGQLKVTFEEGLVTAVGAVVYRGGGPCEYGVGIFPSKPHETMVLLDDGPYEGPGRRPQEYVKGLATTLNNAMLAAGFKPGKPFEWDRETGESTPPSGPTVYLYVGWTDAEKKPHRARLSDWLWNFKLIEVMADGKFVYTGSMIYDEGPPEHRKWLGAEMDGLIVAVLNTSTSMIDCVEDGSAENGCYEAIPVRMPETGTRVTVLFSSKPLEVTEHYPPLKLPKELEEEKERRKREAEKASPPAEEGKPGEPEKKEKGS